MANLTELRRVVCGHDWADLAEWAQAVDQLADLSDADIEALAHPTAAAVVLQHAA
jgi:hypothetical protein